MPLIRTFNDPANMVDPADIKLPSHLFVGAIVTCGINAEGEKLLADATPSARPVTGDSPKHTFGVEVDMSKYQNLDE